MKKNAKKLQAVDEAIMQELLGQPGVRENVAKMNPETLEWFKAILIRDGTYARYVKERKDGKRGRRV